MKRDTGWVMGVALAAAALSGCDQTPHSLTAARACLREKDLACAETNFRGYLKHYPHDYRSTGVLTILLSQEGKHADAVRFGKIATDGGVSDDQLFANYAVSLEATGNIPGAIKWNRAAIGLNPSLVDVTATLARLLVQTGQLNEALGVLTSFDESLRSKGQPTHFTEEIGIIRQKMGALTDATAPPDAAPG